MKKQEKKTYRTIISQYLADMKILTGLNPLKDITKEEASRMLDFMETSLKKFHWMNNNRLEFIMKNGMEGAYGEFYGMNVKTLNHWVGKYYESNKDKIIQEIHRQKELTEKKIDESEKEFWRQKGIDRFKEMFTKCKLEFDKQVMEVSSLEEINIFVPKLFEWGGPYWIDKFEKLGVLIRSNYSNGIDDQVKKEMRLEGKFDVSHGFVGRRDNLIWKRFIIDCLKLGIDLREKL